MTELQKRKIVQFRKEGLGYMKIGQLYCKKTDRAGHTVTVRPWKVAAGEYKEYFAKRKIQR